MPDFMAGKRGRVFILTSQAGNRPLPPEKSSDMTENAIEQIRQFVSRHADGMVPDDDQDLFDDGYVNSLFVVQLVMWIERTFGIQIDRGDLDFVNFATIAAIASLVARKATAEVQPSGAAAGGQSWTSA